MHSPARPRAPQSRSRLLSVLLLCTLLLLLQPSPALAARRRRCARCPRGFAARRGSCVARWVRCGRHHHRDHGAECYKRHVRPGRLPTAVCRRGHERLWGECYAPCPPGFFAEFDTCYRRADPTHAAPRRRAPPLRRACPRGMWLQGAFCRGRCPDGYEWAVSACRVRWCPRGTVDKGDTCVKQSRPCLRRK